MALIACLFSQRYKKSIELGKVNEVNKIDKINRIYKIDKIKSSQVNKVVFIKQIFRYYCSSVVTEGVKTKLSIFLTMY